MLLSIPKELDKPISQRRVWLRPCVHKVGMCDIDEEPCKIATQCLGMVYPFSEAPKVKGHSLYIQRYPSQRQHPYRRLPIPQK